MDIGIGLPNAIRGVSGGTLVEWSARAERLGFSSLATIDRVAFPSYESLVTLAASAAVTERIGLVTNILLAPTRNPILLAKEAASVDQISGGRLTLGLGVGTREEDFVATQKRFDDRGRRFDEDLELMHGAWRGELVGGCPQPPTPEPTRDGGVPVIIGGRSDRAIERAVRWGIGWTAGGGSAEQVAPIAERVRSSWREAGREGAPKIMALQYFALGDEAVGASNLRDYYGDHDWVDAMIGSMPNSAADVRHSIASFEDAGVDELVLDPTVPDVDEVDRLAEAAL